MTQRLKELREKRAKLVHDARTFFDQITNDTPEAEAKALETKFDEIMAEADKLTAEIERLERLEAQERSLEEVPPSEQRRSGREDRVSDPDETEETREDLTPDAVFRQAVRYGGASLDAEQREVFAGMRANVTPEMRAQAAGTDAAGGFTVPEGFVAEIVRSMAAFGPMLDPGVTRVINTTSGNDLPWPTTDDTANKGVLLAENTQAAEQDVVFGNKILEAFMYTSRIIRVSLQLLQDSAFDMNSLLRDLFGERIGRIANEHLTVGTGTGQPNGIVTAATAGITTASGTAIASDELFDVMHSVDPAYRESPNFRWMFNDATFLVIRKLKDGDGNYLWQLGDVRSEAPNTLLGKPYTINQDMASIALSSVPIIVGDFNKYVVRRVLDFTLLRLVERYADFLQVGFIAFNRIDGELLDTSAVKRLTMAAA